MVFEVQQHKQWFSLQIGVFCEPESPQALQQSLIKILDNGMDHIIFQLYPNKQLNNMLNQSQSSEQQSHNQQIFNLDLDKCLIPSEKAFLRKDYRHMVVRMSPILYSCQKEFKFLIGYTGYLGISTILLQLKQDNCKLLQQVLNESDIYKARVSILLHIQLTGQEQTDDTFWQAYLKMRSNLPKSISDKIKISIQLSPNLHNHQVQMSLLRDLLGDGYQKESRRSLLLLNVLQAIKKVILSFLMPSKELSGNCSNFKKAVDCSDKVIECIKFVCFCFKKNVQKIEEREVVAINLQDCLQNPLQPYSDNLESETYEIFEFDTPKYDQYHLALCQAMQSLPEDKIVTIYYIGAGRGGIIPKIFAASKETKRKFFVYLIEKNPYPIQALKARIKEHKWGKYVQIVHQDMKQYQMKQKPDIFLSELLGGFGDNELSPQCLLWAEKYLAEGTICIPKRYSSYIRPTSYQSIHRGLSLNKREWYYTVKMGKFYSAFQSVKVWEFEHPLIQEPGTLNRNSRSQFVAKEVCIVDGFIGYFTTHLHQKSGYISIRPQDHTPGSFSWFQLYFSFIDVEFLLKGQMIVINLRRVNRDQERIVFYQWDYSIFNHQGKQKKKSKVHNQGGIQVLIEL